VLIANIIADECIRQIGKTLTYNVNKRCPDFEPCETPVVMKIEEESVLST